MNGSRDSAASIAIGYGLDNWRIRAQVLIGSRIFSSPHSWDQFWGPPSFLSNGYWGAFFPRVKQSELGRWPLVSN
jgi:hypothetical protein